MTNFFKFLYNTYNKALSVSLRKTNINDEKQRLKRIKKIGNLRTRIESRIRFNKELQEECDKMNHDIGIPDYYRPTDIIVIQTVGYKPLVECSEALYKM